MLCKSNIVHAYSCVYNGFQTYRLAMVVLWKSIWELTIVTVAFSVVSHTTNIYCVPYLYFSDDCRAIVGQFKENSSYYNYAHMLLFITSCASGRMLDSYTCAQCPATTRL